VSTQSGRSEGRRGVGARSATTPAALPRLNSNNCNEAPIPAHLREAYNRLSTNHRKTAFNLSRAVARLCATYGIERVGFLTLTFADHVTCAKEAGRRFHSLRTGVLANRYCESICVLERMKSGRIHFHLLVVLPDDIRTGFNFAEASAGVYTSASTRLRAEWAFWRRTAKEYGFGRTELLPVKSNEEGLSRYVGKYIAKHVGQREERDKGVRLVRYSKGASAGTSAFMFASPRSRLWRWQVGEFARRNGCSDLASMREKFGRRWGHFKRAEIMAIEPPPVVVLVTDEGESVTMWDIWAADRAAITRAVAASLGVSEEEAHESLFGRFRRREISFEVPRWSGVRVVRAKSDFEDELTLILQDGTAHRLTHASPRFEGLGLQVVHALPGSGARR